jgi:hypothetical protein
MSKRRTNLTINPNLFEEAQKLMSLRNFDDFSSFVEQLIREELERRQGPKTMPPPTYPAPRAQTAALNEAPPAAPKPAKRIADGRKAARQ